MAEQLLDGILVQQFFNSILIQVPTYSAQGVGNLIVRPAHVLDLKVISCHSCHPFMSNGIQIGNHHDVGQRVIVSLDEEGLVLQVLLKLVSHGPLEGQELQFGGVVLEFASFKATTGISYGMVPAIILLLGEHSPQSFY